MLRTPDFEIVRWRLRFGRNHTFYYGTEVVYNGDRLSLEEVTAEDCYGVKIEDGRKSSKTVLIPGLGWHMLPRIYRTTEGLPETVYSSRNIQEIIDKNRVRVPLMPLNPKRRRYKFEFGRVSDLMQLLGGGGTDEMLVYNWNGCFRRTLESSQIHPIVARLLSE